MQVQPIGHPGNIPTSVAEWLESLELGNYTQSFLINGYTSMELVKKIWEAELISVSDLTSCIPIVKWSENPHALNQLISVEIVLHKYLSM